MDLFLLLSNYACLPGPEELNYPPERNSEKLPDLQAPASGHAAKAKKVAAHMGPTWLSIYLRTRQ